MRNAKYIVFKNFEKAKKTINSIDKNTYSFVMKTQEMRYEDMYLWGALDKSLKLIDSFIFALDKRNITVLATLTRMQMDCALRTFAIFLVDNSTLFCKEIIENLKQVNKFKSKNGKYLRDQYLCEQLGDYLDLPVYDKYQIVCNYVHLSPYSFYNIAMPDEEKENSVKMLISRENIDRQTDDYDRQSLELASMFYYFNRVLVEDIYASWLYQKRELF